MSRSTTIELECSINARFELFFGTRGISEHFEMEVNTDKVLTGGAAIIALKKIMQLTSSDFAIAVLSAMIATATMQQREYEETVEGFENTNFLEHEFKDAEIEACAYMQPKLTISYRD